MKKLLFIAIALIIGNGIRSQDKAEDLKPSFSLSGFVSATAFVQDQEFRFGNGQNASYVNSNYDGGKLIKGFDIRNTRLTAAYRGPKVFGGWATSAVLETDLFGGFFGSSAFSASQQYFRIRLAFFDIAKGDLRIRIGQAWSPMFNNPPVSLSHVAFPLGYGSAGFIGWRYPGVQAFYSINSGSAINFRLDAAIMNGSWNEPGASPNLMNPGNLGFPQFELKFSMFSGTSNLYVLLHYDQKELAPAGSSDKSQLNGQALQFGAKTKINGLLLQGSLYTGKNIGHQFGSITQLPATNQDLSSMGAWLQIGYDINKNWGVFGFIGFEDVDKEQALKAFADPRTKHQLMNFMIKYTDEPISFGLEYMNSKLTFGPDDEQWEGNQFAFSTLYRF